MLRGLERRIRSHIGTVWAISKVRQLQVRWRDGIVHGVPCMLIVCCSHARKYETLS